MVDDFDKLLQIEMPVLERFVRFRIGNVHDAEDVLQETCIAAFNGFGGLKDESLFKPWLLGIARHKCNDYFREKAKSLEIPIDELRETAISYGVRGITTVSAVRETLDLLGGKDKQILYLYYFKELQQEEIAKRLSLPLGTVKSRLYNAKQRFKENYPYKPKGEKLMLTKMPKTLSEYTITPADQPPFSVKWEEIMGWFIVPKIGERLEWAMYDFPDRKRTEFMLEEAVARAEVHGIEGVEILAKEAYLPKDVYEKVRADTIKPLGKFVGIDRMETGHEAPNVILQYVMYEKLGLRIKYVFYGGLISGLWFNYYEK